MYTKAIQPLRSCSVGRTCTQGTPPQSPQARTHPHTSPLLAELRTFHSRDISERGTRGTGAAHLSGVRLFPFSFTSRSSSEESTGEVVLASRSSCSCWARYWAGFCLASLAQCSSSRCSRGRLACKSIAHVKGGGLQVISTETKRKKQKSNETLLWNETAASILN